MAKAVYVGETLRQIPNVSGDHAAGADDAPHFRDRPRGVVQKDDDQRHDGGIETGDREGQGGGVACMQLHVGGQTALGIGEHVRRAVKAVQFSGGGAFSK